MVKVSNQESIWTPQFIEDINQDICLDCDRVTEIGGSNAFKLRSLDSSSNGVEHHVLAVANPEQCIDCNGCTSTNSDNYAHYSFSI